MRYPGRLSAAFTLVTLVLLVAACESSKQTAEIVTGKDKGKLVIQVASSDEAFVVFRKLAEEYAVRHGLKFEVIQTQSMNIMGLLEKQAIDPGSDRAANEVRNHVAHSSGCVSGRPGQLSRVRSVEDQWPARLPHGGDPA